MSCLMLCLCQRLQLIMPVRCNSSARSSVSGTITLMSVPAPSADSFDDLGIDKAPNGDVPSTSTLEDELGF